MLATLKQIDGTQTMNTLSLHLPAPTKAAAAAIDSDLRRVMRRGLLVLTLGLGGFVGLAAWAPVDQAVSGTGVLGAASQRKAIQHAQGGPIALMAVREGDLVTAGQTLFTLDVAPQRAELLALQRQALLLAASRERLAALLAGQVQLGFSAALLAQAQTVNDGAALLARQRALFASQRDGQVQGQGQMSARAAQLRAELAGTEQALAGAREQQSLSEQQTRQLETLTAQGYYPRLRLMEAQRQSQAQQQEVTRLATDAHRVREALGEAASSRALRSSEQRREWESELLEAERQAATLLARQGALQHQLAQAQVVAPTAGTVVGLHAQAAGSVVRPAETVMEIVPAEDALVVEARFALAAGEKLHAGQAARLHFSTLDAVRTPVLQGSVLTVSADKLEDARSGEPYLRVRVAVPPAEQRRLQDSGASLRPGLPAEVFVQLGERSLLGWLTKPLVDRLARAFND